MSADSAVANAYKRWEGVGVDRKELKAAIADAKLDTATRQRKFANHVRNMAWLGKPIGFQGAFDLGDEDRETDSPTLPMPGPSMAGPELIDPFKAGQLAFGDGLDVSENPYIKGSGSHDLWGKGWTAQYANQRVVRHGDSATPPEAA